MITTPVERWMLPDGIEEVLPDEAIHIERLRQALLQELSCWGYDLVIPPMVEFTDSLLVGLGQDIDLMTFKVTDQISGRSMGIRADMTPQIARIDAHSLRRSGTNRLCYSGPVVRTAMHNALDSRCPLQVGAELFGQPGLAADKEMACLLLSLFHAADISDVCLDLGHVGIYRALSEAAGLSKQQERAFFELLQSKALPDINSWLDANVKDAQSANWLRELPRLSGAKPVLDKAETLFAEAPAEVGVALTELREVADTVQARYPQAQLYFDLSELTGYHYLTGLVFAVFAQGRGAAIAKGGRYDHIGEVFGRARSAIGFSADLVAMHRLRDMCHMAVSGIFVQATLVDSYWQDIQKLRASGERVICANENQLLPEVHQLCDRQLVETNGQVQIVPLKTK